MIAANDPKARIRALRIVIMALAAGAGIFLFIALVINQLQPPMVPELMDHRTVVIAVVLALCFLILVAAKRNFNKRMTAAKNSLIPLGGKLEMYTEALILYAAGCEGCVLLNVVLFFLTADFVFLPFSAVMLGLLIALYPTRKKLVDQLALNSSEERELE